MKSKRICVILLMGNFLPAHFVSAQQLATSQQSIPGMDISSSELQQKLFDSSDISALQLSTTKRMQNESLDRPEAQLLLKKALPKLDYSPPRVSTPIDDWDQTFDLVDLVLTAPTVEPESNDPPITPPFDPGINGHILPGAEIIQLTLKFVKDPVLRAAVNDSIKNDWSSCSDAATKINKFSHDLEAPTPKGVFQNQRQKVIVDEYLDHCLEGVYAGGRTNLSPKIRKGMAIIKLKNDKYGRSICTGFFRSPTTLSTARHCFFSGKNTSSGQNSIDVDAYEVIALSDKIEDADSVFSIASASKSTRTCLKGGDPFPCVSSRPSNVGKIDGDYLELTVDRPVPGVSETPVESGDLKVGRQLIIVMFNRIAWQRNRNHFGELSKFSREIYRRSVNLDHGPACMVLHSSNRCVIQACQSFFSSSGSPVFSVHPESSTIGFLGTLFGGYKAEDNRCNAGTTIRPTPNVVSRVIK